MNWTDAICRVLAEAGKPILYVDITNYQCSIKVFEGIKNMIDSICCWTIVGDEMWGGKFSE